MHLPSISPGRVRRREAGSAVTEFTLVLLPMMALIFLMLDTAWMIFARASLQQAVREGVRFGIVGQLAPGCSGLTASIQQVVQANSSGFVNAKNASSVVNVRYTAPSDSSTALTGCSATSSGNILQVTVAGISVAPMAPLWRSSSPFVLSASAADAMEASQNSCP